MNARMISAELLRLRKNRALDVWMFIMTCGAVAAFFLIAEGFHLNNSRQNGPAGGASNLEHAVVVISFIGSVAAAILGSTVGTNDLGSGVFRDLVVTGKSRTVLFLARVPGMLVFWVPMAITAYVIGVIFDVAFAGGLATPGIAPIIKDGLWAVMVTCIALCTSMGVAALIGSRGISIGVLLGWQLAATPLLLNISQLGITREAILSAATSRVSPIPGRSGPGGDAARALHTSLAAAIVVLVAWIIIPLAAGGWRTVTRDA